jgi:hypothetical protein
MKKTRGLSPVSILLLPDLQAPDPRQLTRSRSNSAAPRTNDILSVEVEPDRVSKRRTQPVGNVGCSPADGFGWRFQGGSAESAHRSKKFLLGVQVPAIINRQDTSNLGVRLHWCCLQSLG